MNKNMIKMILYFLGDYEEELSDRICNDFNLKEFIPEKREREQFVKDYHNWNGDPEEYNPDNLNLPDFAVVTFLIERLRKEIYEQS